MRTQRSGKLVGRLSALGYAGEPRGRRPPACCSTQRRRPGRRRQRLKQIERIAFEDCRPEALDHCRKCCLAHLSHCAPPGQGRRQPSCLAGAAGAPTSYKKWAGPALCLLASSHSDRVCFGTGYWLNNGGVELKASTPQGFKASAFAFSVRLMPGACFPLRAISLDSVLETVNHGCRYCRSPHYMQLHLST